MRCALVVLNHIKTRIMKNILVVIASLLFPLGIQAQSNTGNHLAFVGIPMNSSLSGMVQSLQNRGFVELKDDDLDQFLDEETELPFLMGYSGDRTTMEGNFYGSPCIIDIQADPENKNVYSIGGRYDTCYANLWQAQGPFDALISKMAAVYGAGKYMVSDAEEKEYRIQNGFGTIILRIDKIGVALKNEGKFEINFLFIDSCKVATNARP